MATRTTRSTTKKTPKTIAKASKSAAQTSSKSKKRTAPLSDDEESIGEGSDEEQDDGDDVFEDDDQDDAESINSDNLDDEDNDTYGKRRRPAGQSPKKSKGSSPTKKSSPRKKRKTVDAEDGSEDGDVELDLAEGQEVVGKVVQAPKAGRVPPGCISQNTFNFLNQLKRPECNDREWFKLHEPVYRLAEKEWKDFVDAFTDILVAADPQIPHLPPKDVIHRIYRDIRFSNDKTPYKTGFSASFSRSGRKGIFAAYHVAIRPGGDSMIAAGSWCPAKNELATIRNNLLRSSTRLRNIISSPTFEGLFGEAKPQTDGSRSNIFGREDELKVAPKGVAKDHKDIDLLKCRSFAVVYQFTDKQVLQPDFKDELGRLVAILRPFVHCLNDLMTIQDQDSDSDDDEDDDEAEGEDASVAAQSNGEE